MEVVSNYNKDIAVKFNKSNMNWTNIYVDQAIAPLLNQMKQFHGILSTEMGSIRGELSKISSVKTTLNKVSKWYHCWWLHYWNYKIGREDAEYGM